MTEPQEYDVNLDDVPRDQLGEIDPMYAVVAEALFGWLRYWAADPASQHGVGTFLGDLAAEGYRVTAIDVPDIHLPTPTE